MHDFPFLAAISGTQNLPPPFDETQAGERYAEWTARIQKHSDAAFATLNDNPTSNALLACLFGTTPFLTRLLLRHPEHYLQIAKDGPDKVMQQIATLLRNTPSPGIDADSLGKTLRDLRAQAALTIAIADISGHWTLQQVTRALSDFAQQILQCAIDGLLLIAGAAGEIELTDPKNPSDHCGYVLLGMGKLGAGELNYSSDVDLIALYDPDRCAYSGKRSLRDFQIRFTQKLVKLLQDFTEDGYVFRTDLRLRPDPAATPVALPIEAAETYYESVGKGWERAAMIKARPIAGDIAVGQAFLQHIRPFIWRKSLDFAAIHDVNNMIGLIHSHHGHDAIRIAGHNVKLGIGGIREIEFLVQTHQLIAGGRERQLQTPGTLALLDVLERLGRLPGEARAGLAEAYIFLRTVEHRLQMLNDEQTHSLPEDADGLARIAAFMGMPAGDRFEATLRRHLDFVARQFRSLMATGLVQPSDEGDTRIPLGTEVPTAETLRDFHFAEPEQALEILARWRAYRYRAFQTRRAQALLDHLTPQILKALGATADPDGALRRVDNFLALLPAGIQVLSLFNANPWLLETLAEIMGTAPTLAETLARNPLLLDAMLSRDFMQEFPQKPALAADLARALEPAADLEEVLNLSRRWANDRKFQVGVQLLCGLIDGEDTGAALSDIADTLLTAMLPRVSTDFAQKHGTVPDGGMAVVAMGKLGGCELTFTSDLDLVFIYTGSEPSDGPKSLTAGHYFARLAQRYINALTALTEEGQLYEIDMRLRPSGQQGPIAVSLQGFTEYQRDQAASWEHLAWTRARIITAPDPLAGKIAKALKEFITRPRDGAQLAAEIAQMRERVDKEFGSDNAWNFKYVRGGMMDIEFLAQFLILREAQRHPALIGGNTVATLQQLQAADILAPQDAETLIAAITLQRDAQQIVRLCLNVTLDATRAPAALRRLLAKQTGQADFSALCAHLAAIQADAAAIYRRILPANDASA